MMVQSRCLLSVAYNKVTYSIAPIWSLCIMNSWWSESRSGLRWVCDECQSIIIYSINSSKEKVQGREWCGD